MRIWNIISFENESLDGPFNKVLLTLMFSRCLPKQYSTPGEALEWIQWVQLNPWILRSSTNFLRKKMFYPDKKYFVGADGQGIRLSILKLSHSQDTFSKKDALVN